MDLQEFKDVLARGVFGKTKRRWFLRN